MVDNQRGGLLRGADGGIAELKAEAVAQGKVNHADLHRALQGLFQAGLELAAVIVEIKRVKEEGQRYGGRTQQQGDQGDNGMAAQTLKHWGRSP